MTVMSRHFAAVGLLVGCLVTSSCADLPKGETPTTSSPTPHELQERRSLAEQGLADVQFTLGMMYAQGQGVAQDHPEAARWFRLAAEQGNPRAQNNLGLMYELGHGVVEDYIQAHVWFSLAATQGLTAAEKNRTRLEKKMTLAQILEAQILARERTTTP